MGLRTSSRYDSYPQKSVRAEPARKPARPCSFDILGEVAGRFPGILSRSVTHGYSHENRCAKHLGVRRLDAALVVLLAVMPRRRRAAALQDASHTGIDDG